MIIDAGSVPDGTILDADLCIVGAGAAGIALAREFIHSPLRVVVLESGGMGYEPDTQDLYAGQSRGQPFEDLTACRLRYFGGTTNHWGGWCLPYDAIDFEPRDDLPYHGWPFSRSHLDPWYRRAQAVCQLGPFNYHPSSWGITADRIPPPFSGPDFECKILQDNPLRFGPAYAPELRRAARLSVYLHANAVNLLPEQGRAGIRALAVKTLSGNSFTVRARIYVLAAGGIENARLLLASGPEDGNGLGNEHDLVGRFLMVHLVYPAGSIIPAHPRAPFDFRTRIIRTIDGGTHSCVSFIGLTAGAMRNRHLPNIMLNWGYDFPPLKGALDALDGLLHLRGSAGVLLTELGQVVHHLEGIGEFAVRKELFGESIPIRQLNVHGTSEQLPNPRSRVTLGSRRDRLGMREVVVDWQWLPEDKIKAAETLHVLATEVGRTGFGRFRPLVLADAPWPDGFYGNEHQMGTTRMHPDPALGVVDANCRVQTLGNLYVAGSSVFPSGGANNPTLTIVALALRLADHIKERLA